MTRRTQTARTHIASGRFVFLALAAWIPASGCATGTVEATPRQAEPSFPDPVLAPGPLGAGQQERAALLYARAREAMEWGRTSQARRLAGEIVDSYPSAPVSGRALWLLANVMRAEGDLVAADQAAGRWANLLSPGDPRIGEARLFQAEVLADEGDEAGRLRRLMAIGPGAPEEVVVRALEEARSAVAEIRRAELEAILAEAPSNALVRPPALVRLAGLTASAGRGDEARTLAAEALATGALGADSVLAAAILEGRDPGFREPGGEIHFATVLPEGGSPAFRDFARLIAEGVEVAAATYLQDGTVVRVESLDDRGDPSVAAALARGLDETGVLGAVGFLEEGALEAAGAERPATLPLVSPTARTAAGEGLYTLSGADPRAAVEMARHVATAGFQRVAIVHSEAPESSEEAAAFEVAVRELGIPIDGIYAYPAGATFFGEEIRAARTALRAAEIRALGLGPDDTLHVEDLEKVALFLPIPPEDVELLAPQVTFYGLDTLAIEVLGTSGWTDPQTLLAVDNRHTTGVVATAPVGGEADSEGFERFRVAYETHFRRSLTSRVPALGYDAALLLLEAAREGGGTRARILDAFQRIDGLEGATGTYSVLDGRVLRQTRLVRIEQGSFLPIG